MILVFCPSAKSIFKSPSIIAGMVGDSDKINDCKILEKSCKFKFGERYMLERDSVKVCEKLVCTVTESHFPFVKD